MTHEQAKPGLTSPAARCSAQTPSLALGCVTFARCNVSQSGFDVTQSNFDATQSSFDRTQSERELNYQTRRSRSGCTSQPSLVLQ